MKSLHILSICLTVGAVVACRPSDTAPTTPTEQSPQKLLEKAERFAAGELARLSAAEMLYRDRVYLHVYSYPSAGLQNSAYAKRYRQFTDYEVLDVVKSNSLLHPYLFEIQYNFEILSTDGVPVTIPNVKAARAAARDHRFRRIRSDTIRLEYRCDRDGDPVQSTPTILERPNYFQKGTKDVMGEFQVQEVPRIMLREPTPSRSR